VTLASKLVALDVFGERPDLVKEAAAPAFMPELGGHDVFRRDQGLAEQTGRDALGLVGLQQRPRQVSILALERHVEELELVPDRVGT
jgi:hypothetical protein